MSRASEMLEVVWVRLHDVSEPLREARTLMSTTLELGSPLEVYMACLADPNEPIKMKFGCRVPVQLKSHITIFVNLQGFKIRVERVLDGKDKGDLPPPPPPPAHEDKDDDPEDPALSSDEDVDWDSRRCPESPTGRGPSPRMGRCPFPPLSRILGWLWRLRRN